METVRSTEREVASWIAGEINRLLETGGFPFQSATVETSVSSEYKKGSGFPDIIIWKDRSSNSAYSFIELKIPGKTEDLSKLPTKAKDLGVSYIFVSNFQSGNIYEVNNNVLNSLKNYNQNVLNDIELWKDKQVQIKIKQYFEQFINDLSALHEKGTPA